MTNVLKLVLAQYFFISRLRYGFSEVRISDEKSDPRTPLPQVIMKRRKWEKGKKWLVSKISYNINMYKSFL